MPVMGAHRTRQTHKCRVHCSPPPECSLQRGKLSLSPEAACVCSLFTAEARVRRSSSLRSQSVPVILSWGHLATRGTFINIWRHFRLSQLEAAARIQWVDTRDAAKLPPMPKAPPQPRMIGRINVVHVHCASGENPCSP